MCVSVCHDLQIHWRQRGELFRMSTRKNDQVRKVVPSSPTTSLRNFWMGKALRVREKLWLRVTVVPIPWSNPMTSPRLLSLICIVGVRDRAWVGLLWSLNQMMHRKALYRWSGFKSDRITEGIMLWHCCLAAFPTSNTFLDQEPDSKMFQADSNNKDSWRIATYFFVICPFVKIPIFLFRIW